MLSIDEVELTEQKILEHLDHFENFCLGKEKLEPAAFRDINSELSICAVLIIGKRRYQNTNNAKHLIWIGLDNREYDLGRTDDVNVMRDYPGFHGTRTLALGHDQVAETKFIDNPNGKGSLCEIIMKDGSRAIGPNYRMALRNASLKMHLKTHFNSMSLSSIWNGIWGNA